MTRVFFWVFCFVSILRLASSLPVFTYNNSNDWSYGHHYSSITDTIVNGKRVDDDNSNNANNNFISTVSGDELRIFDHRSLQSVGASILVLYLLFIGLCTIILRLRHRGPDDPVYPILKAAVLNYANIFELLYYVPVNVEESVDLDL